jgi:hypothetical protein
LGDSWALAWKKEYTLKWRPENSRVASWMMGALHRPDVRAAGRRVPALAAMALLCAGGLGAGGAMAMVPASRLLARARWATTARAAPARAGAPPARAPAARPRAAPRMMFDRLEKSAVRALMEAQKEAKRFGASQVDASHVLLGLASQKDGTGAALETMGVTPQKVTAAAVRRPPPAA